MEKITDYFTIEEMKKPGINERLVFFEKNKVNPPALPEKFNDELYWPMVYFATLPEFQKGNPVELMKTVRKVSGKCRIPFTSKARPQMALLATYRASNPDYQMADPKGKLANLKKLVDDEAISSLIISEHFSMVAQELLVNTPSDQQKKVFEEISPFMDIITKTPVEAFFNSSISDEPKKEEHKSEEPKKEEPKKETENSGKDLPKIVSGITCSDGTTYIFLSNGTFFPYNQEEKKVEEGYPKPVDDQT